jgi:hypothetical protein
MSIWRKLLYFGGGIFLGILMVNFLFGGRDDIQCSYFPNDRVLYDLRGKKERIITPQAHQHLRQYGLDTAWVSDLLWNGKVNFEESNTKGDSCNTYWITYAAENIAAFTANFMNCDSSAVLLEVQKVK